MITYVIYFNFSEEDNVPVDPESIQVTSRSQDIENETGMILVSHLFDCETLKILKIESDIMNCIFFWSVSDFKQNYLKTCNFSSKMLN